MNRPHSRVDVGVDVLLRAAGISLVVLNHATSVSQAPHFLAGLNVILVVAGFSFIRFLPQRASASQIRGALLAYGAGIGWPSLLMMAVSIAVFPFWRAPGRTAELSLHNVALFPVWYPVELVQFIVVLALVFSAPGVATTLARRPWLTTLALVVFTVLIRQAETHLWRTGVLDGSGPHLMLWNLAAGMMLFAATRSPRRMLASAASFLIVAALCWVTWGPGALRTWSTLAAAALLLGVSRVSLPFALARGLLIVSQACLFIFLLHKPAIWAFDAFTQTTDTIASFIWALSVTTAAWVICTAGSRALRRMPVGGRVAAVAPAR
jgi:hypothetical protein